MQLRKILAAAAATAVAVSTLAVSSFAAPEGSVKSYFSTWTGDKVEATDYVFDAAWGGGWTQFTDPNDTTEGLVGPITIADAANWDVVFEITTEGQVDDDLLMKAGDTSQETYSAKAVAGATEYTIVFNAADLNTQASGDYVGFNFQAGAQAKTTVTIYAVPAGTVEASNNAPTADDTDDTDTDDTDTDTDAGDTDADDTDDKGNADTGVEGVAAVAGLAIVAAGAIVVAKKRK